MMVVSTVFLAGGSALAQTDTGYPPGTTTSTTAGPCTPGDTNLGTLSVGTTRTFTLCGGFTGGTVTIKVDGTVVPVTKSPSNGFVTIEIRVVSRTVIQIDDPVNAAVICGNNTVTATGAGNPGTATATFTLACPTETSEAPGGLAFTGANVLLALLIALVLIVLGAVLVVLQRRRRQTL
ncbi:MAG: hypothetical protein M3083_00215 [Actinomycetota bacterium]|nr:hypothetical protein [Actinomycetota bacterium]